MPVSKRRKTKTIPPCPGPAAAPEPRLPEADLLHDQGIQAFQAGEIGKAFDLVLKAIQLNEKVPLYHYNIGTILHAAGRIDEAMKAFSNAIRLNPNYADACTNLGFMFALKRQWNEAIQCYRRSMALNPKGFYAPNNLGAALLEQGKTDEAEQAFRSALALNPQFPEAHNNLGIVLKRRGQLQQALESYQKAVEIAPRYAEAYVNLGNALRELNRPDEALEPLHKALTLRPHYPQALYNLACVHFQNRNLEQADQVLAQAIAAQPDYAEPHLTHAILSLLRGDFENGWKEYEWRWRTRDAKALWAQAPAWNGGTIAGQTILLVTEQGLGDALQFIRYAALVKAQASPARILFHCPAPLVNLFKQIESIDEIIPIGHPIPAHDCYALLMSLPLLCGTTSEAAIPNQVPYLKADPAKAKAWKAKIETAETRQNRQEPSAPLPLREGMGEGLPPRETNSQPVPPVAPIPPPSPPVRGGKQEALATRQAQGQACGRNQTLRIGLLWAGNPRKDVPDANSIDKRRSMRLAQFAPLAGIKNVRFYSLQKDGDAAQEAATPPPGMNLIDLMPDVADFADTAALIANLDLVIGVDTSVIHLAGAMGKPVWVLSRHDGCWRWLLGREDNPWYPTLRLFRQEKAGAWGEVVERVRAALNGFAATETRFQ